MTDLIDRQTIIEAIHSAIYPFFCGTEDGDALSEDEKLVLSVNKAVCTAIKALPSAQPERLTDDDFETIRIHLNAYKEKLCNQHRWEEADEYQRIIDRFMSFASAQPEIIRCKDCKHWMPYDWMFSEVWRSVSMDDYSDDEIGCAYCDMNMHANDFCSRAERKNDG